MEQPPNAKRTDAVSVAVVQSWSAASTMPGRYPELSDQAALLTASGQLDASARNALVARLTYPASLPTSHAAVGPGGFAEFRSLVDALDTIDKYMSSSTVPAPVRTALKARRVPIARRVDTARRVIIGGRGIYATSVRAIRRERRDGLHLELHDREMLCTALAHTPSPLRENYLRRAGATLFGRVKGAAETFADRAPGWLSALAGESLADGDDSRFTDGYETLLFAAGCFYDRVMSCPAWHSEYFFDQRVSVDMNSELADIAADVYALRAIRIDLDANAHSADAAMDQASQRREQALRPVWNELLHRVVALGGIAHVVESAARELNIVAASETGRSIDDRIDDLVSRSGRREMSVDNAQRVTEQLRAGEEQLRIYRDVLHGNITQLTTQDNSTVAKD